MGRNVGLHPFPTANQGSCRCRSRGRWGGCRWSGGVGNSISRRRHCICGSVWRTSLQRSRVELIECVLLADTAVGRDASGFVRLLEWGYGRHVMDESME